MYSETIEEKQTACVPCIVFVMLLFLLPAPPHAGWCTVGIANEANNVAVCV